MWNACKLAGVSFHVTPHLKLRVLYNKLVLYCIVLYCIALHCIVLYCIALYCNVGCVWFIYRKMKLQYWLVPGNVKSNRIN